MMTPYQALAVRRLLLFAAALAATVGAHAVSMHGLVLVPAAPFAWGALGALAVLAGGRRARPWRERAPEGILARLLTLQIGLHCAMTAAPWAFGLGVHHRPALVTPLAVAAHAVAAIALTALLTGAERLLTLAQRLARAVRSAFSPGPARCRHRPAAPLPVHRIPRAPGRRPDHARGPPAVAV